MLFKLKTNFSASHSVSGIFATAVFFILIIALSTVFAYWLSAPEQARAGDTCGTDVNAAAPTGTGVDPIATLLTWSLPGSCVIDSVTATISGTGISGDGTCTGVNLVSCTNSDYNNSIDLLDNTTYDVEVSYDWTSVLGSQTHFTSWSFTTGTAGSAPGKPLNFTPLSSSRTTTQIQWSWDTPTSGGTVNEYRWQCGIVIGDSSVLTYLQTGLAANIQYSGDVCACNTIGCGSDSVSKSAYTSIEDATGATFSNIGVNNMDVAPQGTFTNLTVGSSGIKTGLFTNSTCSGAPKFDSGWRTTTSAYSFTGLSVNTTYWAGFQTKNGDGDTNSWTCHGSATTVDTTAPTVNVTGAPGSWQNIDATIGVSCDDGVSGSGCDSATAATAQYLSSPPANCPTTLANGDYDQPGSFPVSSHSWFCATEQDNSGNDGFSSAPVEFKVDKIVPTFTSFTVDNSVCAKLTATVAGAADADSGLDASPYRFSRSRNPPTRAQFSKNTK